MDLSWQARAECAKAPDPSIFFAQPGRPGCTYIVAKRYCARCAARAECLEYALAVEPSWMRYGLFGGLSPEERDALFHGRRSVPRERAGV